MRKIAVATFCVFLLLGLAACGGGGSSASTDKLTIVGSGS